MVLDARISEGGGGKKLTPKQVTASKKAEKIDAMNDSAATAYQTSLTAKPKTPAEQAALSQVAKETGFAILNNLALPAAAYTGVPSQPNPASTWTGTEWTTPAGVTGSGVGSTTARSILEMYLRNAGIPQSIIPSSVSYLEALDEAGIKDEQTLIDLYMNNKNFTTKTGTVLNSPFYAKYTALGEGVINPNTDKPYTAKELFAFRLGMEDKVNQYGKSPLFVTDDNLKKFIKNGVSVDDFEKRIQQASLAAATADPAKVSALTKLGFIKDSKDLENFYLNPEIGQKQLEENQRVGAFATEAVRFAGKGINFDEARIRQISAMYGMQTETQAADSANKLYSGVAENLQQTVALAGMYDKTGLRAAEESKGVQTELENELLLATPADRRKRLEETNLRAFQGRSGGDQGSLGSRSTLGLV